MRIALFATCIGDVMFPQAPQATTHLLERLGHEVVFPPDQACCGQMHVNTGYFPEAMPIIANHVKTFEPVLDGDALVLRTAASTADGTYSGWLVLPDLGLRVPWTATVVDRRNGQR